MKILIPHLKYRLMWAQKYNVPLMDGQLSQDIKVMHQTVQEFAIIRIIAERLNRVRYVKIFHSNPTTLSMLFKMKFKKRTCGYTLIDQL